MNCMRCGQEISSDQVFCEDCRAVMKKYPVNSDTPVYVPRKRESAVSKKPVKRRSVSLEEKIHSLQKMLWFFVIWSMIVTALALAMVYPTIHYLTTDHFKPGQNYSSITTITPAETEPA